MTMRIMATLALAGLVAAIPACGDSGGDYGSSDAPEGIESDLIEALESVEIPSQDELDSEAEAAITDSNAEAELEALLQEIEDDG